jgi:hypothetical protein
MVVVRRMAIAEFWRWWVSGWRCDGQGGCWRLWVSVAFLKGYLDALGRSVLLSAADAALQPLLEVFLLHRLLDGLEDHLGTQPALVKPGCEGILELLQPHRKR